jgi:hypothetical protein
MNGKRMFQWLAAFGVAALTVTAAEAAPFLDMFAANRVKADPNDKYALEQKHGPWMIMACSFSGDVAEKQADELVYELRSRYKLPAYVYKHTFDPGEAVSRCLDEKGNLRKACYQKFKNDPNQARHPQITEIAVLVGNYSSPDNADAQTTLKKIRYADPDALKVKEGKTNYQSMNGLQNLQKQIYIKIGSEKQKLGPMRHALVTRNPLLPAEYFNVQAALTEEVTALNKGVPYSLLESPGKYTVRVATFQGSSVIQQRDVRDIEEGRLQMKSQLAAAAKTADTLVHALRKKGFEAYQFHDHHSSIVTVGSFDSPGVVQPSGQMEWDPQVVKIVQVFGPKTQEEIKPELQNYVATHALSQSTAAYSLSKAFPLEDKNGKQTGEFIPLDIQPQVVAIPKQSFGQSFRGPEESYRTKSDCGEHHGDTAATEKNI